MRKVLLVIGYVWPEPCSSAAGGHMLNLLRMFKDAGWQVHFSSPAARGEHEIDLRVEDIESHEIVLNCSSFDSFVKELQPSAVLFDRYMMEEQFSWRVEKICPDAVRIIDMEDVHSLRDARHKAIKLGKSLEEADIDTELAKREAAAIFRSDLTLVISDTEMQILQDQYMIPKYLLEYCPLMLDEYNEGEVSYEDREHFITIGNFRHAPNWDAVLRLKQDIWPAIRRQLPHAEMHIYGSYPPPKAVQLHDQKTGFLVKGWINDARAVMSKARVCLAPLRFGAGMKGKLVEAMLCGTPSVTTKVGAEGIQGSFEWPGAVEDGMSSFVSEAISLYQNQDIWNEMQKQCGYLLNNRFDRDETKSRVVSRVETILTTLPVHRRKNFIGGVLRHQSMKASQYMSQWIEEKNKNLRG